MIYLKTFDLMTQRQEDDYIAKIRHTCFNSYYPLGIFTCEKELSHLDFCEITIFCGGNGSGKSTLLNVIAEKVKLSRQTIFNKTHFFDPYLEHCHYQLSTEDRTELRDLYAVSKIITSDDVFNNIIEVRRRNENLIFKRNLILEDRYEERLHGGNYKNDRPRRIDMDDPESFERFKEYNRVSKLSTSQLVRERVGIDERTYSNGENGFRYFTDAIQPGGLYLLDEPENSLSAEMQLELVNFLHGMARFYNCQFILSTHSPFILSLPHAKIYNMDAVPVSTCKWTELSNVRIFHDFFQEHQTEFQ